MTDWRNRIVGHGEVPLSDILFNPKNWRIHPKPQKEALAGAIAEVGFIRSVTVNRTTGNLIDGHLRVLLADEQGQESIPVEFVELSEAEEAEALATIDPIGMLAVADKGKLDELLRDVQSGEAGVQAMLAELAAKTGLVPPSDPLAEWEGMPSFEHEDKTAFRSLIIHFKDQDAVNQFAQLVNQTVTDRTRFLWFPEIEIEHYIDKQYSDES